MIGDGFYSFRDLLKPALITKFHNCVSFASVEMKGNAGRSGVAPVRGGEQRIDDKELFVKISLIGLYFFDRSQKNCFLFIQKGQD
jgi:hypothetical protein